MNTRAFCTIFMRILGEKLKDRIHKTNYFLITKASAQLKLGVYSAVADSADWTYPSKPSSPALLTTELYSKVVIRRQSSGYLSLSTKSGVN